MYENKCLINNLYIIQTLAIKIIPLSNVNINMSVSGVSGFNPLINTNANTATKSCTNKNPIAILPYNVSKSFLSVNNFTIIIVLLNVNAMLIYTASIDG